MIADGVLERFPGLDRHGFCVGNIAPDCDVGFSKKGNCEHPNSGYLTEILPLKSFPNYIDYLPQGCIIRKIGVMGYLPEQDKAIKYISMSQVEYAKFVEDTIHLVVELERWRFDKAGGVIWLDFLHLQISIMMS